MKPSSRALLSLVLGLALVSVVFADTISTVVYFDVPSNTAFTVTLPGAMSNQSGQITPFISFNSTDQNAKLVQPCVLGGAALCQVGNGTPIFQYRNAGNTNMSLWLQFTSTLPIEVKVGVNSTVQNGSAVGTTWQLMGGDPGGHIGVNSTGWANLAYNVTVGGYINVSMWANFSGFSGTAYRTLTHNSTSTYAVS